MKTLIIKSLIIVIISSFLVSNMQAKSIYYVKVNGTGDGTSWTNAAGNIQAMIDKAISGDEVWVAKGTYYPTTELISRDSRSRSFIIKDNISMFGGFAGTETSISQRELSDLDANGKIDSCEMSNKSILSGDVDGVNDVWTKTTNSDGTWEWNISGNNGNCCRVVTCQPSFTKMTYLDGFSIIGGNGNYNGGFNSGGGIYTQAQDNLCVNKCIVTNCFSNDSGGGIYINGAKSIIKNCIVTNCSTRAHGGGIYYWGGNSQEQISNCTISNCSAIGYGGGISGVIIKQSTISNCSAANGGGIYLIQNGQISTCLINNCLAKSNGGGIYGGSLINVNNSTITDCAAMSTSSYGGGFYGSNNSYIRYCIIRNCSAAYGGGIRGDSYSRAVNCTVTNCSASITGGGISSEYVTSSTASNCFCSSQYGYAGIGGYSIENCAASNNKSGTSISNFLNSAFFTGNISSEINNDFYIKPTSFIGIASTDSQKSELLSADWHLKEGSSCINAGISGVDIGAYKFDMPIIQLPIIENFDNLSDWNNSEVFYNSAQINGNSNIKWKLTNQKAVFSWHTNITSSYNQPIFTYQIDATNLSKVILHYDMYYEAYSGSISPLGTEKLNVEYSKDLVNWTPITTYSNANGTIANKNYQFDLSSLLAGNKFYIRFNANGVNSNRIEKWEIDNVIVNSDFTTAISNIQEFKYTYLINNGNLIIGNLKQIEKVELYDINGILLNNICANSETIRISIPKHGIYIIKVTSGLNVETKKIVW